MKMELRFQSVELMELLVDACLAIVWVFVNMTC